VYFQADRQKQNIAVSCPMPPNYSVKQVAEILGYSTNSIYTFLQEGKIKSIRIGRGKIKIGQDEVNRLLAITKKPSTIETSVLSVPETRLPELDKDQRLVGSQSQFMKAVEVPSLPDWLIGLASLAAGTTAITFSATQALSGFSAVASLFTLSSVCLVCGGLGVLLADIVGYRQRSWYQLFGLTILIAQIGQVILLWRLGDSSGSFLHICLSLFVLAWLFVPQMTLRLLPYLLAGLAWTLPALLGVNYLNNLSRLNPDFWFLILILVGVTGFGLTVVLLLRSATFRFGCQLTAGILFAGALLLTAGQHISEVFILLTTGLIAVVLPHWQKVPFFSLKDRYRVFSMFGLVLFLFIAAIATLWVVQSVVIDFTGRQMADKANYGRIFLENRLDSAQKSLESATKNPIFVSALTDHDLALTLGMTRSLFEGNENLRRINVLDTQGNIIVDYPEAPALTGNNFSSRDYFRLPATLHRSVKTDIFTSAVSDNLPVIAVGVPIIDNNDHLRGVLAALYDLVSLGKRLQELTNAENAEYFTVVDRNGNYVINPDSDRLYSPAPKNSLVRNGLAGLTGTGLSLDQNNVLTLQAYDSIRVDKNRWGISVEAPVSAILKPLSPTITVLVGLLILSLVTLSLLYRTRSSSNSA
jgi:excisionase family DNA binding protein